MSTPQPSSGSSAYCTVDQFLSRYDKRAVVQLLSNTTRPVTLDSLETNTDLLELLGEASGMVEAAVCVGNAYLIDDSTNELASLTGNSAKMLAGLVAHLTYWLVWNRRPNPSPGEKFPTACQYALDQLELLRKGERVLGLAAQKDAGHLSHVVETGPTVEARRPTTVIADRLFGIRTNRLQR